MENHAMQGKEMFSEFHWNDRSVDGLTFFKNWLGIIGSWPQNAQNPFSRVKCIFAITVQVVGTVSLGMETSLHCNGLEETLEAFMLFAVNLIGLLKHLTYILTSKYTLFLLESMSEDWSMLRPKYHWRIMESYFQKARRIYSSFAYMGCTCCTIIITLGLPIHSLLFFSKTIETNMTESKSFILPGQCVWKDPSLPVYSMIQILQAVDLLMIYTSHCATDSFFFMFTMHLCGQFHTLKTDFMTLQNEASITAKHLQDLIETHRRLLKISFNLERAINLNALYQLSTSVILLCIEGFNSSYLLKQCFQLIAYINMNDVTQAVKHMIIISTALVQIFLYSFAGQSLEQESQDMSNAVYTCSWYNSDVSTMKNLSFMIMCSREPQQLTAAKFLPMNFVSFKEILKSSASYFSVLRVMTRAH